MVRKPIELGRRNTDATVFGGIPSYVARQPLRNLTMQVLPAILLVSVALVVGACTSAPPSTYPFAVTHTAVVSGRVAALDGSPLDSAVVSVAIPPRALYGYTTSPVATNKSGEYVYTIERVMAPPSVPALDTASVEITVQLLGSRYRNPNESIQLQRDSLLVTFVPNGHTPPAIRKDFLFQR